MMLRICFFLASLLILSTARGDDWPQWLGPQRDGVWRETGILTRFPRGGPKVLWRTPIGGGYAGPAVAGGKVYVTDRQLAAGSSDPKDPFKRTDSKGTERVLCLDEKTGKVLWKHEYECRYTMSYPAGPRATPIIRDGKLWTLGAMGDLYCLDAGSGKVVWHKDLRKEYRAQVPVWGFSAHLLLDGDNLITLVGRDPAVVALDRDTGKEKWRSLKIASADVGYCPPVIYTFAGKRQLIIWHPESVNGLDPATGKPLWKWEWAINANLTVSMPRQYGNKLFLTAFYNSSLMLEPGAADVKEVWAGKGRSEQDTDALHSIMPTPVVQGDYAYGVCSYGQLRCIDLRTGKRVWEDLTATGTGGRKVRWANAFLIPNGDRFFLFNEVGNLLIAKLTPKGYEEIDRAHLLEPTYALTSGRFTPARKVLWSHPAFANKAMFARNDKEIVAVSLAE